MIFGDKDRFAIEIVPDVSGNDAGIRWGFTAIWIGTRMIGRNSSFPDSYRSLADRLELWMSRDSAYLAAELLKLPIHKTMLEIYANVYWSKYDRTLTSENETSVLADYVIAPNGLEAFDNSFAVCVGAGSKMFLACITADIAPALEFGNLVDHDCASVYVERKYLHDVLLTGFQWLSLNAQA